MSPYDPVVPSDPYSIPDPDAGTDLFDLTHLLTVGATWLTAVTGVVTLSLVVWNCVRPPHLGAMSQPLRGGSDGCYGR